MGNEGQPERTCMYALAIGLHCMWCSSCCIVEHARAAASACCKALLTPSGQPVCVCVCVCVCDMTTGETVLQ
eukprot:1157697-Pelagomonas_calceolata.AAC.10